ncbi:MAG: cell division protein FtsH, partial [Alphaproteobacteria bacterium]|nr:cell division protein FtsH [Alphaproteobacteria bacterium]
EKILKVHMRKVPLAPDVNSRTIARGTPGFSGADLANLVNEAALLAARKGRRVVTMEEFEESKDKVMMGAERRSMVMSDEEKKLTAYHESGHAVVAARCEASDPIHKATIIPRGRALGMVQRLPERDRLSVSREKMLADITVAMGGRIAEEHVFGHDKVTSGASQDIEVATHFAREMVTRYGMSEELGPLTYAENQEEVFLGHSVSRTQNISEKTSETIDAEIRRIVDECYARAEDILTSEMDKLHKVAGALLEYETLTGDEINQIMAGHDIERQKPSETPEDHTPPSAVPAAGGPGGKAPNAKPGFGPEPQPES